MPLAFVCYLLLHKYILKLSMLGKNFSRWPFEIFSANRIWHFIQGDNLHEMSVCLLGKIRKNINNLSSDAFFQRLLNNQTVPYLSNTRGIKEEYLVIILGQFFLFLHKNLIIYMLWYSLEVPHWGTSNEYPQHMFLWRIRENYPIIITKYTSLTVPLNNICLLLFSNFFLLQNRTELYWR